MGFVNFSRLSKECGDRIAVVDVMGAIKFIFPDGDTRDSQGVIDRGCKVSRRLTIGCGVGPVPVRRANHDASCGATASNEHSLEQSETRNRARHRTILGCTATLQ